MAMSLGHASVAQCACFWAPSMVFCKLKKLSKLVLLAIKLGTTLHNCSLCHRSARTQMT